MSAASGRSAWRWLKLVAFTLLGAYAVLGLAAWVFQRRLIYFPDPGPVPAPSGPPWERLEALTLKTEDGPRIQAWYLPGATASAATVLVFHGNAGHRGHRAFLVEGLHALGYGVLLPDYRGYGGSEGSPSEEGFYADAEACRSWLAQNTHGPVIYMGVSIGSGVAVELATRHPPAALILQSGFPSLADVASHAYPFLPCRWFVRDRYENVTKIGRVRVPLLMVHGDRDRIVPERLARALFDAAHEPKRWYEVELAGHNDIVLAGGTAYWTAVKAFVDEYAR